MGFTRRIAIAFRNVISWEKIMEIINNNEHDMKKILITIQKEIETYHYNKWSSKVERIYPNMLKNTHIDINSAAKAWKRLNIKKSAFLQVVMLQENATIIGCKKAAITHNTTDKYCQHCQGIVTSITHVLLQCPIMKKKQIERHDNICIAIYKLMLQKLFQNSIADVVNEPPKCIRSEDGKKIITFNKEIIPRSVLASIARRPDIYYEDYNKNLAIIIDVTIVQDENVEQGYIYKINKYSMLQEYIRRNKNIKDVYILPMVFTTRGVYA